MEIFMAKTLAEVIREQGDIVRKIAPEIDSFPQEVLYRQALSILDGDVEKFKAVLKNAQILQPYAGNHRCGDPDESVGKSVTKASYAVVLALCGNDVSKAREYDSIGLIGIPKMLPWFCAMARISAAYSDTQTGSK